MDFCGYFFGYILPLLWEHRRIFLKNILENFSVNFLCNASENSRSIFWELFQKFSGEIYLTIFWKFLCQLLWKLFKWLLLYFLRIDWNHPGQPFEKVIDNFFENFLAIFFNISWAFPFLETSLKFLETSMKNYCGNLQIKHAEVILNYRKNLRRSFHKA